MTEIDSQAGLKYELDKAIESENFERAAELNDKRRASQRQQDQRSQHTQRR